MANVEDLTERYIALGFDPIPARRYAESGRVPPELDEWINTGVPSKDRTVICPKKSQESDTSEF